MTYHVRVTCWHGSSHWKLSEGAVQACTNHDVTSTLSAMLIHHVLLCRMEQQYIDAYEGEGWQGANREKVRSRRDIQQAHLQACPPSFPTSLDAQVSRSSCGLRTALKRIAMHMSAQCLLIFWMSM